MNGGRIEPCPPLSPFMFHLSLFIPPARAVLNFGIVVDWPSKADPEQGEIMARE